MTEMLLFHHAQGQTDGFLAFADEIRRVGHVVYTPDLFEGRTFETVEAGVAYAGEVGFGAIIDHGVRQAEALPKDLVYAGFSLGVLPAQKLAQTRPGARGALCFHSFVPTTEFGSAWPVGLAVQVHAMDGDPFFVDEGDLEAARHLVDTVDSAELFLYPGAEHLFADASLASYDREAARLLMDRVLGFLAEA